MPISFQNTYVKLPRAFYEPVEPTPVAAPEVIAFNTGLAGELGLEEDGLEIEEIFSGNRIPLGAEPIAMAYSGHQFGGFSPVLGDGRAILLGEVVGEDGMRRDIQLKGSGPTPFSRRGDGRSALGPVLREYLVSEAMAVLGIPTTRALAALTTGENVYREQIEPGGVFTRVARSHLRIGTVQYFAARQDLKNLQILVDYAVERHFPDDIDSDNKALSLLEGVLKRQASLVSKWMGIGFIHGVMNTDNMSLSGETIDYGPCAFLDHYDPAKRFSYIDNGGRYAFDNQPLITHWNLTRLAECLLPLLDEKKERAVELAEGTLDGFSSEFEKLYIDQFCRKIGIAASSKNGWAIADSFLEILADQAVDFTLAFRHLSSQLTGKGTAAFVDLFDDLEPVSQWLEEWRSHLESNSINSKSAEQLMQKSNPVYIPRNHRIEEVIEAGKQGDFEPFHRLHEVLQRPFEVREEAQAYELAPEPHQVVPATYCGT